LACSGACQPCLKVYRDFLPAWSWISLTGLLSFLASLEEAGIVEGVSWMNYFLVIFIALPLALLMMVKVNIKTRTILTIVKDSSFTGDLQQNGA